MPLPGSPYDGGHRRRAGARPAPGGPEHGERLVPAHERRLRAVGERLRQRQRSRVRPRVALLLAKPLRERARLARRRHAQLALEAGAEGLVGGHGRRPVPAQSQPSHQHPRAVLGHGIELEPPARVGHGGVQVAGRLGRLAERREQLAGALALRPARLEHPVVVEVHEQVGSGQLERVGVLRVSTQTSAPSARPTRSRSATR